MLRLNPFAALRPALELADEVSAVPYDVVNTEEARALAVGRPNSFLHVSRSEIDLPPGTNPYDDRVYKAAAGALQGMVERGALVREYRQEATLNGKHVSQTGIVGCCHIDDYNENRIKKHEVTRKDKEDDRTRHTMIIRANEPVFLTYKPQQDLNALTDAVKKTAPLYDFTAPDGVHHTVWRIEDATPFVAGFGKLECAYVADGHHRSASAARTGAELRKANPSHTGNEEYNWFLCVLFAADELNVLPYHRLVRDLGGLTPEQLLSKLGAIASLEKTDKPIGEQAGSFGMFLGGDWYRVQLPSSAIDANDPIRSLDYMLLSDHILGPLLGIQDLRTDKRIDFVGGIRGTGELEKRVRSGEHAVAFAMRSTSVEQVMRVADAGLIMPPKSTWFEPKLRSGLLVHTLD